MFVKHSVRFPSSLKEIPVTVFTSEIDECEGVNLDGEGPNALHEFAMQCSLYPAAVGRLLFPSRKRGHVKAARILGTYARNKIQAIEARLAGNIELVLTYEACCENNYHALPKFARW